jgi:hypothetical protein
MKIEFQTANTLAAHAVCVAAGTRDSLRTAQFYVRDISRADSGNGRRNVAFLSGLVARLARLTDRFMTWGANVAIALFLPGWRKLPSPFAPGMMNEVAEAIRKNSLVHNPLFNAYFFRAAIHIIKRYSEPPYLLLEHRVDAARRQLAVGQASELPEAETDFLARTLLALVETAPVARVGKPLGSLRLFEDAEPNVAIFAIACVALLFAEEGKPIAIHDEDEFFAIVGALILPRLKDISAFIANRDVAGLSTELADIKAMY